jgi:CHAT domain-containing protein
MEVALLLGSIYITGGVAMKQKSTCIRILLNSVVAVLASITWLTSALSIVAVNNAIAQQPKLFSPTETNSANQQAYAKAKKLMEDALMIRQEKTPQSLQQALEKYEEALKIWQSLGNQSSKVVDTLESIAGMYSLIQPEQAIKNYNQALKILRTENNLSGQASTLYLIAIFYERWEQYDKALFTYQQKLEINKLQNDLKSQASTVESIASLYERKLNQPAKAIELLNQLLNSQKSQKDFQGQAETLVKLAKVYINFEQPEKSAAAYKKALAAYHQLLEVQRTQKNLKLQIETLEEIAGINKTINQPQKALQIYQELLNLQKVSGDLEGQHLTLLRMASTHLQMQKLQQAMIIYHQMLQNQRSSKDLSGQADTFWAIAEAYERSGQPEKAIEAYYQQAKIEQSQQKFEEQALTLSKISNTYVNLYFSAKDTGKSNAEVYGQKARIALNKKIVAYDQLLQKTKVKKDVTKQAEVIKEKGLAFAQLLQYQKSLDTLNYALKILQNDVKNLKNLKFEMEMNLAEQSIVLSRLADVHNRLKDDRKYLGYTILARQKSLTAYGEKDIEVTFESLKVLSDAYIKLGDRQKALKTLEKIYKFPENDKNLPLIAKTFSEMAEIYINSGETQRALEFYTKAFTLQQKVANLTEQSTLITGQSTILEHMGDIYLSLGDYELSLGTYFQALRLSQKEVSKLRNVSAAGAGVIDSSHISILQEPIYGKQAVLLWNIGQVYLAKGNYNKALETLNQARRVVYSNNTYQPYQMHPLLSMVETYIKLKDYKAALSVAYKITEEVPEGHFRKQKTKIYSYGYQGRVHLAARDYQNALKAFQQALAFWQQDREEKVQDMDRKLQLRIGEAYTGLKQYSNAIDTYNQVLQKERKVGSLFEESKIHHLIAVTERDRGNLQAARTQIETSLQIVENLRTKVIDPQLRNTYFASVQNYYEFYIDLLMKLDRQQPQKKYKEFALGASERKRARGLLELLTEAHVDIRKGVDPKLLEQERDWQFKFDALEKRRIELYNSGKLTKVQIESIEQEKNNLMSQYRTLQAQIRATSPSYAALTQPQPLSLAQIQQKVLDDDSVLLEYSLGEERSYLWAVTKNGLYTSILPKRSEIETAAKKFRDALSSSNSRTQLGNDVVKTGLLLRKLILEPVSSHLKGKKRLLLVSDGALQYIPFSAIPTSSTAIDHSVLPPPLLMEHEIINLPSASTLATLRHELAGRQSTAKSIAIFADPVFSNKDERIKNSKQQTQEPVTSSDKILNAVPLSFQTLRSSATESGISFGRLPGTRQEAQTIINLMHDSSRILALDFDASKTNVIHSNLSQYRIIHFATHGMMNAIHPEQSGVVLSLVDKSGKAQNGFLQLSDIFNLNLSADLVVLSACQTGIGQEVKGEGLISLTRGFMYAGAPRVLVSLWSVNDESTTELMTRFYQNMMLKNLPPAAALRTAQLELQKQPKWKSPYYWAAFTLQGEWK